MAWLWLGIAIVSEVFATITIKLSGNFTKITPFFSYQQDIYFV